GVDINTPLGNLKLDLTSSCLENEKNIAKEYLTEAAPPALDLPSLDVNYSIGEVDFNVGLEASFTENLTGAVTELLDNSVNEEIDQFCSDFYDAAHIETDGSLYSDGINFLLACQVDADATLGNDGLKVNARVDGYLSKHKLGDTDISVANIGLSVKAEVDLSTANVSASVLGLGLNAGTHGVDVDTPIGSFNLRFQP
ncbi:unnamed protein product, partial [Rotaria sp. Silwood1]